MKTKSTVDKETVQSAIAALIQMILIKANGSSVGELTGAIYANNPYDKWLADGVINLNTTSHIQQAVQGSKDASAQQGWVK